MLYYQLRGSGPLLLIAQKRRGRRGPEQRHGRAPGRLLHGPDVRPPRPFAQPPGRPRRRSVAGTARGRRTPVLAAVTNRPALILGCSLGASIGLHLAVAHPEQIAVLVAHEPVTPRLLPDADRARHEHELAELQDIYRHGGLAAAFPAIARVLGIDPRSRDVEPGLTPQPLDAGRRAELRVLHRARLHRRHPRHPRRGGPRPHLDPGDPGSRRRHSPHRVRPPVRHGTRRPHPDHDRDPPSGHNGNTTHPRAYAARLRALLADAA
ncbi:alpha/beta fold hydrolase [Yinghuangia aomiensis]